MIFFSKRHTKNILIKLTHKTGNSHNAHFGVCENKNDMKHSKDEKVWKRLAREHLGYDILMDALFMIHEDNEDLPLLRIPLSVLVSYKGFKALAIANVALADTDEKGDIILPKVGYFNRKYCMDEKF